MFSFFAQLTINRYLPFGIMAGLSIVTAVLCLTLPETRNVPTMEDLHPQHEKDEHISAEKSKLIAAETPIWVLCLLKFRSVMKLEFPHASCIHS